MTYSARRPTFDFLSLPAELRNWVYDYVVGKHRNQQPIFTHGVIGLPEKTFSEKQKARPVYHYPVAFLFTSKQVRGEALAVLYDQNTFHVKLQCFDQLWKASWNVESITKLIIEFSYHSYEWDSDCRSGQTLRGARWDVLRRMANLRSVCLLMSVTYGSGFGTVVMPSDVLGNLAVEFPRGTIGVRQMMRDFVASIPPSVTSVKFGLYGADGSVRELFHDSEMWNRMLFVPASYMRPRCEEFKVPQSCDVGVWAYGLGH